MKELAGALVFIFAILCFTSAQWWPEVKPLLTQHACKGM